MRSFLFLGYEIPETPFLREYRENYQRQPDQFLFSQLTHQCGYEFTWYRTPTGYLYFLGSDVSGLTAEATGQQITAGVKNMLEDIQALDVVLRFLTYRYPVSFPEPRVYTFTADQVEDYDLSDEEDEEETYRTPRYVGYPVRTTEQALALMAHPSDELTELLSKAQAEMMIVNDHLFIGCNSLYKKLLSFREYDDCQPVIDQIFQLIGQEKPEKSIS